MKKQHHVRKYLFLITTCILVVSFLLTGCGRGAVVEKEEEIAEEEEVMISGTITYADYTGGEILLAAFTSRDYQTSTPIATGKISSPGTYSIQVPFNSGEVWIVANNDVNGNGKPDLDEPHGELETPVTVGATNIQNVNLTLMIGGAPSGEGVGEKVMISGTITYADYMGGEILLAAFTSRDYQTSTPIATGKISSPGTYSIQVPINSGQVWIVANNDVNGNGKPDLDEPHGELETPVTVSTINIEKVNITLMIGGAPNGEGAPGEKVTISGTVTYADYTGGEILLAAFTSRDYQTSTPIATGKISSPGTYSIQVPINSGQVYIVANNDVNGNGKPDLDEPHGELENPVTVGAINIEKVNITLAIGGAPTGEGASAFDVLPSLISAEFADDVAEEGKALVIQGISAADFCLQQWFGKSINRPTTLRVSASYAPHVAMENGEMVIYTTAEGNGVEQDVRRGVAHEYVHVYQTHNGFGSHDVDISITPQWFLEGEAEWLSYEIMYEAGLSPPFEFEQMLTTIAKQETDPLKSFEKPTHITGGATPSRYALYTLAVYYLMKDKPKKVSDDFGVNLADGKGMSMPEAFETAFNITLDKFYEDFESYRKTW